jgi:hypothetical protein
MGMELGLLHRGKSRLSVQEQGAEADIWAQRKKKEKEAGENCTMSSDMLCTPCKTLLE